MDNTPSLTDFARRMRSLVEEDVRIAADLRELAKEMRDCGLSAATLKGLVKALVLAEEGNDKPLANLKTKLQDSAIYAEALGISIEGFGEANRFVPTARHDSDGVVLEHELEPTRAPSSATTADTSAPSQGLNGSQPSPPSSDAVPAADAASVPVIPGQSEQAPDPIPAQSHIIRGAEAVE